MFGRLSRRIVSGGMGMMRPGFLVFRVPWTALMEKGLGFSKNTTYIHVPWVTCNNLVSGFLARNLNQKVSRGQLYMLNHGLLPSGLW